MGGQAATDDINQAHRTQVWLAVSDDPAAVVTAGYFYHMQPREVDPDTRNHRRQDHLVEICERLSGVKLDIR